MDWEIGNGRWMIGDCLERMAEIPDGSVDMVLCDLPYGTTACSWDSVIPFEPLWREYWRVCKPNAAVVLTASQPFTTALIGSQIQHFKVEWIWKKNAGSNFALTKYQPMKEHESVCVFARGTPAYYPIMQERAEAGKNRTKYDVKTNSGGTAGKGGVYDIAGSVTKQMGALRVPSSVQLFKRERGLHPTQKPVALFEYLIKTYTLPFELVLDNTAGSGTTAIAAEQSGRRWICIERDLDYSLAACDRIARHVEGARAA